jgi:predicted DNA-binding ArsR family transcriptional regulator
MTPKEKAQELMLKYYALIPMNTVSFAKQCALIAVNEILKCAFYATDEIYNYYLEVKQEIEKL